MTEDQPAKADLYLVESFQAAVRSTAAQLDEIEKLRTRAVAVVGLGGAVGTFVGRDAHGRWVVVAMILFGCALGCIVGILWPVRLSAGLDPVVMVQTVDAGHGGPEALRSAALHIDKVYRTQERRLKPRRFALVAAVTLVSFELIALVLAR